MLVFGFLGVSLALVSAVSANSQNLPQNDFFSESHECVPNQVFIDQCNLCHCAPDGTTGTCTKMACDVPKILHIDNYKDGLSCPAGKSFYKECNTCVCDDSGKSARCTLMMCKTDSKSRRSRKQDVPVVYDYKEGKACPAKFFFDDCNACVCGADGVSAACTRKLCP